MRWKSDEIAAAAAFAFLAEILKRNAPVTGWLTERLPSKWLISGICF
jgi:hypothetical protein